MHLVTFALFLSCHTSIFHLHALASGSLARRVEQLMKTRRMMMKTMMMRTLTLVLMMTWADSSRVSLLELTKLAERATLDFKNFI